LLALALGLRVGFASCYPNFFHADEVYQTLEPAHRLVYGYGVIPWEWRTGIRSWILPVFLAGVMRVTGWMGSGSAGYIFGVDVFLSIASLTTVWFGYLWAKRVSGREAAIIAAGACSCFFALVYFAPKALTEIVATDFLLPGLYLGVYGEQVNEKKRLLLAGILCGLAASLRIQLIPTVAVAALYFCFPRWRQRIPAVLAGLALPILAFGLVDAFTWSYPFQSFIRNFQVNVLEGRSLAYRVDPWYWYLTVLLYLLGPMVVFLWKGARRSPFLAILFLVIVGSHSLFSHKEIRFIYPAIPMAITLASVGFVESIAKIKSRLNLPEVSRLVVVVGVLCFALSSLLFVRTSVLQHKATGAALAFDQLSRDPMLCGVALDRVYWMVVGGYTHLHRDVPIIPVQDGADFMNKAPAFNALVAPIAISGVPSSFERGDCWSGICVYRRAGACIAPKPQDTLNAVLQRTGQ
jgi:4-amino-4-deoxy-L-arabinose transferase-like glycosyltransferase